MAVAQLNGGFRPWASWRGWHRPRLRLAGFAGLVSQEEAGDYYRNHDERIAAEAFSGGSKTRRTCLRMSPRWGRCRWWLRCELTLSPQLPGRRNPLSRPCLKAVLGKPKGGLFAVVSRGFGIRPTARRECRVLAGRRVPLLDRHEFVLRGHFPLSLARNTPSVCCQKGRANGGQTW